MFGIPLQVNWMETAEEIDDLFLGDAEVWSIYLCIFFYQRPASIFLTYFGCLPDATKLNPF